MKKSECTKRQRVETICVSPGYPFEHRHVGVVQGNETFAADSFNPLP